MLCIWKAPFVDSRADGGVFQCDLKNGHVTKIMATTSPYDIDVLNSSLLVVSHQHHISSLQYEDGRWNVLSILGINEEGCDRCEKTASFA